MHRLFRASLVCLIVLALSPLAVAGEKPRVFTVDPADLARAKEKFLAKEDATREVVEDIQKDANEALKVKPFSVMDKEYVPPSGRSIAFGSFHEGEIKTRPTLPSSEGFGRFRAGAGLLLFVVSVGFL